MQKGKIKTAASSTVQNTVIMVADLGLHVGNGNMLG